MEAFFSWLGAAFGALFVIAVVVAWWEHLVRSTRSPAPPEPAVPRAVNVDVRLDGLAVAELVAPVNPDVPAASRSVSDTAQRRATLNGAMSRMARPSLDGSAWTETSPMVLHAPAEPPSPAPTSAPTSGSEPASKPAQTPTRA